MAPKKAMKKPAAAPAAKPAAKAAPEKQWVWVKIAKAYRNGRYCWMKVGPRNALGTWVRAANYKVPNAPPRGAFMGSGNTSSSSTFTVTGQQQHQHQHQQQYT